MFHRKRILSNIEPEKQMYDNAFFPEERLGFINQYQNSGLYPRSPINSMSQINYYQFGILDMPVSQYYQKEWWHFVYKTPRRW